MTFEYLSEQNVDQYIVYLKKAMNQEPDLMTAEGVEEDRIRQRLQDPFYGNTKSILAFYDGHVAGRIEFHFYGCIQDGYRMAYIDWVYVLPEHRRRGIARQLFWEFENACRKQSIDQYYLIRAKNPAAERFYRGFEGAELSEEPTLRRYIGETE